TSDTSFNAVVSVKLGPVSAKFKGDVELTDLDPPFGYTISGTGSGGIAGFAKGSARVRLTPVNGGTTLSYEVDAQIGGKLAQLGARLIDSTSRKLAMEFFENFGEQVGQHASAKVAASPRG
ncbi:CoxG family protein, partial [Mesorhizobium sp. P5_C1]